MTSWATRDLRAEKQASTLLADLRPRWAAGVKDIDITFVQSAAPATLIREMSWTCGKSALSPDSACNANRIHCYSADVLAHNT